MLLFNKPQVNEKELMIQQRKKASFTSKCAKFEGVKEPILTKKESLTKVRCEESRFFGCESSPISPNVRSSVSALVRALDKCKIRLIKAK